MTLSTTVRLSSPVPVKPLLDHLTVLVGGDPETAMRQGPGPSDPKWHDDGRWEFGNRIMQGFAAIVELTWYPDGPLPVRSEYHEEGDPDDPPGVISIWLDTAYGYKGPNGETCVQLHQHLAREALAFARKYDPNATASCNIDSWGEWWDVDTMEDHR